MKFDETVAFLLESLEQPYPYRYKNEEEGYIFYPDIKNKKIFYSVVLVRFDENGDYDPYKGNVLEIAFRYNNLKTKEIGVMDTKTPAAGNAFKILATVKAIVKEYFSKKRNMNKITEIIFTSKPSEKGKIKVYNKFLQQIANTLGTEWKTEISPGTGDREGYVLFRAYKS